MAPRVKVGGLGEAPAWLGGRMAQGGRSENPFSYSRRGLLFFIICSKRGLLFLDNLLLLLFFFFFFFFYIFTCFKPSKGPVDWFIKTREIMAKHIALRSTMEG